MKTNNLNKGLILTVIMLMFTVLVHAQNITVNFKGKAIAQALSDIESQTNYSFVYQKQVLADVPDVTCRMNNATLEQVLDEICSKSGLSYEIVNQSIIIRKAENQHRSAAVNVSGKVTDEQAEPQVGVTVRNANTGAYSTTDIDGKYSISASNGDMLVFTCIGMAERSVKVGNSSVLDVELQQDNELLEATVVVGYGTAKKISSVVGASTLVKSDAFDHSTAASAGDALQGKVAGLQIYSSSGEPSADVTMRLRGVSSINASTTPLFILDGTPVDVAIFTALNPNDIESVNVMKDASSTAIYGSRAANGVIYITTKKGTGEKPMISVSASYGVSSLAQFPIKLMNSEEWFAFREMSDPSLKNNEQFQQLKEFRLKNKIGTDWRKWILNENAPTWKADASISGRSDRTDYYISIGGYKQEGIMPFSDMGRYNIRSNINTRITDWLKMGVNLNLAYQTSHRAGYSTTSTGYYNPMNIIAWGLPYATPYEIITDESGNFKGYGPEQDFITDLGLNNYFTVMRNNPTERNTARINANVYEEVTPIKGLVLRAVQAVDAFDSRYTDKIKPTDKITVSPQTSESFKRFYRLTSTNTAEYKFAVVDKHHFDILAGHESIVSKDNYFLASTKGQIDARMTDLNHGTVAEMPDYSNSKIAYNSFFARLSYDFNDKYFLDGTFRVDGSSLFGSNKRYAPFWSVGAMWNIYNEPFLKDISWINLLQVKASFGTMGNSGIDNYLSYGKTSTGLTYDSATSWYMASLSNPDLTWETVEAFNIGVNGRLMNWLTFNIEFYNKNTKDMLMYIPYSFITGFSGGWGNVGKMRNRGLDLELKFDALRTKDWYLGISFNMNYNKNTITELYDGRDEFVDGSTGLKYQVGKAYGEFFVVKFAGVDPANGKSLWYDADGNITGTYSESNAVFIGKNRFAPWSGGATLDLSWRNISLNAAFAGVFGKSMENYDRYFIESPAFADESNMTRRMLDIWTTPGQITEIPNDASKHDSRYIEDASFVRLKNIQLSYTMPKKWMKATGFMRGAKVYVSGRNLLTFTRYKGWDPEVDAITAMGNYPNTKQFTVGVELQF